MRLGSLLPLLALGSGVRAAALSSSSSPASSHLFSRDLDLLNTRDLEQLSVGDVELLTRALVERDLLEDIWEKLKDATTCTGGELLLGALKVLAFFGDRAFIEVIQGICKLAKVQSHDVCDGAVALEAPIIAAGIRKMSIGSRSSKAFLTSFMGVCGYPDVQSWDIVFPSAQPSGGRSDPSGKDPIEIVHYSDIHIDPLYVPGSSTQCDGRPLCCRPYTEDDQPGKTKFPAGPNGDHMCDVPFTLERSMYDAINSIVPDAAFTIFTGDIVDHAVWNTTQPYNTNSIQHAYGAMNSSLKLVYGTVGNHEAHPVNSFVPNAIGHDSQWLYNLLSSDWEHWIGKSSTAMVEKIGAYSTKYPKGNLRIISLNTNLYYRYNFWMYQLYDEKDPDGQIAWLINELDAAEKANERVYIIGHTPLGEQDALRDGSNYLDQVFRRYKNTIAASFFGHTHVDHFEVSYGDYEDRMASNAFMTSYIAPSLVPTSGMPSFRVYTVDPDTFAVLDHTTYVADMTDPSFQTTPVWTKFYSAKEAYGPLVSPPLTDPKAELTPAFWHDVTVAFEKEDAQFDAYISRKSRGWRPADCKGDCKTNEICQLRAGRSQDNCWKPKPGINLTKRSEVQHDKGEHDECGVPVTLKILSAVSADDATLKEFKGIMGKVVADARTRGGKSPDSA
ncbi:Sphingomyelin phosphodiesterase [Metarhizium album ARSEF 1941]|uniref:Sphingomyelin phosphodiesterase n=1 Tax=Metarhizium album (strain ARSEF 1941) TaxID=1081103 RepID=A0A0B2X4T9_METAS|nr:Sphingomyelin phosphodiesterase [Metarhizium album ARSEF 1941]KHO00301.1 Sphingomyelin phosphodiesterase [Metarhizium album ARSEF 1941]